MDSHKRSTQVERLEVVETGRRRRWSDDEKLRIVMESLQAPRAISSTARRHGISRSLLMTWRRSFRLESNGADAQQQAGFVPAMLIAAETPPIATAAASSGQMVIIVGKDRRVIVDAGVDTAALARVLEVLERR
jgi:transposase